MTTYTAGIDKSEYGNGFKYNMIAEANLTIGDVVKQTANGINYVAQTSANTDIAIGIAAQTTTSGSPVLIFGSGCKVQTTASLTAGTVYAPAASGALGSKGGQADQNFALCVDGTASSSVIRIL